jgi:hypothetical protein
VLSFNGNTKLLQSRLVNDAIGKVVNAANVNGSLPGGDQLLVKAYLYFHQDAYHGPSTVIAEAPPVGDVPVDPANGHPTTARYVLNFLGGQVPVGLFPDGVQVPAGPGNLWEAKMWEDGWFFTDPPGVTNINAIPPGPDSQDNLHAPNFQEGTLLLDFAFAYLYETQPGYLPLALGFLEQVKADVMG